MKKLRVRPLVVAAVGPCHGDKPRSGQLNESGKCFHHLIVSIVHEIVSVHEESVFVLLVKQLQKSIVKIQHDCDLVPDA